MSQALAERAAPPAQTPVTDAPVAGVVTLPRRAAAFQRRLVLVVTIVPFLGFAAALWTLWGRAIGPVDIAVLLGFYVFVGLGVTIGFHRLLTHRSFRTKTWVRALFAIAGSMAIQGPVIKWVADHRRHHAYADREGDPHSPHLDEGPGIKGVAKGLWHAHMGWFFDDEVTSIKRWAPDLLKDPALRKIDKLFPLWAVLSLVLPGAIGFALTQTWHGALTAFLWGGLARIFLLHHVTWSVNSICHFYGKRPFETPDHSTNNWPLAIVSFGESWHNNHHAFPTSATHGVLRKQVDMSGAVIRLLERTGLAWDVKIASPEGQLPPRS
ncbi:MAG: acyl-CoA desaturase [Actinomycetota bacterium]